MAKGGISKTIRLGDEEKLVRMSAVTPILYNQLINRDFFKDLANFNDSFNSSKREDGLDIDMFVFKGLCYVGVYQASEKELPKFIDWLDGYKDVDFANAFMDLLECWNENSSGTAKEKNTASE